MTDPAVIDPGEELLGRVGLAHVLSGEKRAIHVYKSDPDLSDAVDDTARRFVREPKIPAKPVLPPLDYDVLNKQLSKLAAPAMEPLRYLDAHLIKLYLVAVQRAVSYIAKVFPRDTVTTMTTTRNLRPSESRIGSFRRIWTVANDVKAVFRSLLDGTLTRDQVVAFRVIYPTVFDALKAEILLQIAEMVGEKGTGWSLPYAKDQLLQTVLLTSIDDQGAVKRLQQNFADAKAKAAQQGPSPDSPNRDSRKDTGSEVTSVQRAAQ